jgi:hypothetical protein
MPEGDKEGNGEIADFLYSSSDIPVVLVPFVPFSRQGWEGLKDIISSGGHCKQTT